MPVLTRRDFTFVNEAFCRYVGSSRSQLVGRSFLEKAGEEDRNLFRQMISQLITTVR